MPTAYGPHARVSIGGPLGPDGEIWNCNVSVAQTTSGPFVPAFVADLEAYLDLITPKLQTWFAAGTSQLRSDAFLAYVKANNINPDGSYADGTTTHQRDVIPNVAGGLTAPYPQIISSAFSWKTSQATRGPGSNGRIYPPSGLGSLGKITLVPNQQNLLLTAAQNLLDALNKTAEVPLIVPAIASTKGPVYKITEVRIGSVLDVQRRRKNALTESYVTGPFPAA